MVIYNLLVDWYNCLLRDKEKSNPKQEFELRRRKNLCGILDSGNITDAPLHKIISEAKIADILHCRDQAESLRILCSSLISVTKEKNFQALFK